MANPRTLLVNAASLNPLVIGNVTFPDVQAAIDFALSTGQTSVDILVTPGSYPSAIHVPQGFLCAIASVAVIPGVTALGDITWTCSGTDRLSLSAVTCTSFTVVDGTSPATGAVLTAEQIEVQGNVSQTGTGNVSVVMTGLNNASSEISNIPTTATVSGSLTLPHCNVALENITMQGPIHAFQVSGNGTLFSSNFTCDGSAINLTHCNFAPHVTGSFSGAPGTFFIDAITEYHVANDPALLTNGTLTRLSFNVLVGATIYVDNSITFQQISQTGSEATPFDTVQKAVDYAVSLGRVGTARRFTIRVAVGDYTAQPIVLPELYIWDIIGDLPGNSRIGDITWTTSGGQVPPQLPDSALVLQNLLAKSVTSVDGVAPATTTTLSIVNSQVTNTVTQTGTSNVSILIGGITAANSTILAGLVFCRLGGNISVPHCNVAATECLFLTGTVLCKNLFAQESAFHNDITVINGGIEMLDCRFAGPISASFSGSAGVFSLDSVTNYNFIHAPVTLVNGTTLLTEAPIFAASEVTIPIDGANIVLSPVQYNVEVITFTGNLASGVHRTVTFPLGVWLVSTQDMTFAGAGPNKGSIVVANGANTQTINTPSVFTVSITSGSIVVK
jgi:hypothetical protein